MFSRGNASEGDVRRAHAVRRDRRSIREDDSQREILDRRELRENRTTFLEFVISGS